MKPSFRVTLCFLVWAGQAAEKQDFEKAELWSRKAAFLTDFLTGFGSDEHVIAHGNPDYFTGRMNTLKMVIGELEGTQ